MTKNSIYRAIYERKEKRLHLGYKYKDKILKNTLSGQMFNVNPVLDKFIKKINDIIFNWIESVKQIKVFANPALDKHENKLN